MTPITIYDTATGTIQCCTAVSDNDEVLCAPDEDWIEGHFSDAEYYVDLATQTAVPLNEFDLTIEMNRVSNIPPGTTAVINGETYVVGDEGEIVFELDLPETLRILLIHPLYRALDGLIEVPCEP